MNLIVHADDFGLSSSINDAIAQAFELGLIDRTSAIVNGPMFGEACQLAQEKGFNDRVGFHFNISECKAMSSEISRIRSFCAKDNILSYQRNTKHFLSKDEMNAVASECERQIHSYHSQGLSLIHFDSHEHVHTEWFIFRALEPVLRRNGFSSVRVSQNIGEFSFKNRAYKSIFNYYLKRRGWNSEKFCGSYREFLKLDAFSNMKDADVEVVVHPTLSPKGLLVDAVYGEELVPPLKKLRDLVQILIRPAKEEQ
jgi:predicted glycoside hydrolase/deacetylase ChbG (UPF0249 family)